MSDWRQAADDALLVVTLRRSSIGTKPKTRGTLRALGLRRIDQRATHRNGPVLRGMLSRVEHLVDVQPAPAGGPEVAGGRGEVAG